MIVKDDLNDYKIVETENNVTYMYLPSDLNTASVEMPNFVSNQIILYLSADRIIRGYNFTKNQDRDSNLIDQYDHEYDHIDYEYKVEDGFRFTSCKFPGGEDNINLATILDHGNFLVGENTLSY
jgi:hypothetical protein